MSIIQLQEGNCQNCYKCIRGCPVKAIEFKDGRAAVIEKECILCGACIANCPQNAKYIKSELTEVKGYIQKGQRVYATVAPSWSGYFNTMNFKAFSQALKSLGFYEAEETAIGARQTSNQYELLAQENKMDNIIITACSSVVMLVENFFPSLIPSLAPVSSPMMAHARMMKECYGNDIKVVFIGPCFSKKSEAKDVLAGGFVDHVLTFDEIETWFNKQEVCLEDEDDEAKGVSCPKSRLYPTPCGIIKTMDEQKISKYSIVTVDGLDRCKELFEAIVEDDIKGLMIEANVCAGSCIGGPVMRLRDKRLIVAQSFISDKKQPHDKVAAKTCERDEEHPRAFSSHTIVKKLPNEVEIAAILAKTGKYAKEQELNCGSCGYASCREKAIAVYQGKADINMCLPFFRERAENISNTILSHSPNAIVAVDHELLIQDINKTAEKMFGLKKAECLGMPINMYINSEDFEKAKTDQRPIENTVIYDEYDKIVEQTVIYINKHDMYVAFIKDVTKEMNDAQELKQLRNHTIETAQKVIDKQMRVAQEIASLLGETTAETKVALTHLKKSMAEKTGE